MEQKNNQDQIETIDFSIDKKKIIIECIKKHKIRIIIALIAVIAITVVGCLTLQKDTEYDDFMTYFTAEDYTQAAKTYTIAESKAYSGNTSQLEKIDAYLSSKVEKIVDAFELQQLTYDETLEKLNPYIEATKYFPSSESLKAMENISITEEVYEHSPSNVSSTVLHQAFIEINSIIEAQIDQMIEQLKTNSTLSASEIIDILKENDIYDETDEEFMLLLEELLQPEQDRVIEEIENLVVSQGLLTEAISVLNEIDEALFSFGDLNTIQDRIKQTITARNSNLTELWEFASDAKLNSSANFSSDDVTITNIVGENYLNQIKENSNINLTYLYANLQQTSDFSCYEAIFENLQSSDFKATIQEYIVRTIAIEQKDADNINLYETEHYGQTRSTKFTALENIYRYQLLAPQAESEVSYINLAHYNATFFGISRVEMKASNSINDIVEKSSGFYDYVYNWSSTSGNIGTIEGDFAAEIDEKTVAFYQDNTFKRIVDYQNGNLEKSDFSTNVSDVIAEIEQLMK